MGVEGLHLDVRVLGLEGQCGYCSGRLRENLRERCKWMPGDLVRLDVVV